MPAFQPLLNYLKPVDSRTVSLADSFFLFDLGEAASDGAITVSATPWDSPDLDRLRRIYELALTGIDELKAIPAPAAPSQDFLNTVRAERTNLSLQDRLFALSLLGDAHPERSSPQLALYLSYVARELGFSDVIPQPLGILTFRDPVTKKRFAQKSSGLFQSSRKESSAQDLQEAVIRAENLLPAENSLRPRTLSWTLEQAILPRNSRPVQARFNQRIHKNERTEQLCLRHDQHCTFAWSASDEEKLTSAKAVGTSARSDAFKLSPAEADLQRGLVKRWEERLPELIPSGPSSQALPSARNISLDSDGSIHIETQAAEIAKVRAKTRFLGSEPEHQIGSRIDLGSAADVRSGKLELDFNRQLTGTPSTGISTTDRISVVMDSRDPNRVQPYIQAEGSFYAYRGTVASDRTTGVVTRLKSYLPTEKRGDYYLILRLSDVINAPSTQTATQSSGYGTGAGWSKKLSKSLELTSEVEINNGTSINDMNTLSVSKNSMRQVTGSFILRSSF